MTMDASTEPQPLRPVTLVIAAMVAIALAGVTARVALAGPSTPKSLTAARPVEMGQAAFGAVAEAPVREPRVVVAPTSAAIWASSDEVDIANRARDPRTGRPSAHGDAKTMWSGEMGGFTDQVIGAIHIDKEIAETSHVPHEVLHANASPDFLLTVGVAVDKGVTEQLALKTASTAKPTWRAVSPAPLGGAG